MDLSRRAFLASAGAAALSGRVSASLSDAADGLRIAHLADPQFGFETSRFPHRTGDSSFEKNYAADRERFERALAAVNAAAPDVVVIAGDLCQKPSDMEREWPDYLRRFTAPVLVAPGNHDLGNSVLRDNLVRYERAVGPCWRRLDVKGWRFLVVSSQFWFKTVDAEDERERHRRWLDEEISLARREVAAGRLVVVSHIPPFVHSLDEPDAAGYRCPKAMRAKYADSLVDAGCRFYLAGHTHNFGVHGYREMLVLNPEVTCEGFDRRPQGWRLQTLHADGRFESVFMRV